MEYRREAYPRPQFERNEWVNLNGKWTYSICRRAPFQMSQENSIGNICSEGFENEIQVPFAPETPASGANERELITLMYYHRRLSIPKDWGGKRILLHFGAVYYHAEIYINGIEVDFHDGGSSSFTVDLTKHVEAGKEYNLVVKVTSDLHSAAQPSGKQSSFIQSYACYYQRTTGIWQTVWMEAVSYDALASVRTVWNGEQNTLTLYPEYYHISQGNRFCVEILDADRVVASHMVHAVQGAPVSISFENPQLWEPNNPHLYSLQYSVLNGDKRIDEVASYVGLRTVNICDGFVYLNGKKLYQRLVLDQGFYPESNWTAPSDEALEQDIKLSMAAGFNGARLHQKVFEERFFYYADKLGYLVWAESPSWGSDYNDDALPARNFLCEWAEIINRDLNHPSIVAWTPLNETYLFQNAHNHRRLHRDAYHLCKMIDPTRPVNDASGYIHFITDLWTVHTYEQDPALLSRQLTPTGKDIFRCYPNEESEYDGQPYLVDEFGGIKWDPETQGDAKLAVEQNMASWGYGNAPRSIEEFYSRLQGLVKAVLSKKHIAGYCYTQLTDVEQEKNGIYFYNRDLKFDMNVVKKIFEEIPEGFDI